MARIRPKGQVFGRSPESPGGAAQPSRSSGPSPPTGRSRHRPWAPETSPLPAFTGTRALESFNPLKKRSMAFRFWIGEFAQSLGRDGEIFLV